MGRLGVRSMTTELIAIALLGQQRSPQPPQQEANFGLWPAIIAITKVKLNTVLKGQ